MDWLSNMNSAINYIEDNLTNKIEINEVSKRAYCSSYNFQRMFSFITDTTLAEYIRRRRLTQALLRLMRYFRQRDLNGKMILVQFYLIYKRGFTEWLPTANYERADSANFEIYGGTKEYGYIELWYPIVKK